jgi:hypothetical protein
MVTPAQKKSPGLTHAKAGTSKSTLAQNGPTPHYCGINHPPSQASFVRRRRNDEGENEMPDLRYLVVAGSMGIGGKCRKWKLLKSGVNLGDFGKRWLLLDQVWRAAVKLENM